MIKFNIPSKPKIYMISNKLKKRLLNKLKTSLREKKKRN